MSFTPLSQGSFSSTANIEDEIRTLGEQYVSPEIRNDAGISVQDIPTSINSVEDGAVEKGGISPGI